MPHVQLNRANAVCMCPQTTPSSLRPGSPAMQEKVFCSAGRFAFQLLPWGKWGRRGERVDRFDDRMNNGVPSVRDPGGGCRGRWNQASPLCTSTPQSSIAHGSTPLGRALEQLTRKACPGVCTHTNRVSHPPHINPIITDTQLYPQSRAPASQQQPPPKKRKCRRLATNQLQPPCLLPLPGSKDWA